MSIGRVKGWFANHTTLVGGAEEVGKEWVGLLKHV